MTTDQDFERIVRTWLEPGLTTLTDDVLDAVMDQVPATPQRRRWSTRRIFDMNPIAKYAIAAAAVVVIAIAGFTLLGTSDTSQTGDPRPTITSSSLVPSLAPSATPVPLAATFSDMEPGRYRWTSLAGEVTFTVPDGWTGVVDGIAKNPEGSGRPEFSLVAHLPGTSHEVTHVYADACASEGRLDPIDPNEGLVEALDQQESTDTTIESFSRDGSPTDALSGTRVEIREAAGVDRSACRYGVDGPLQIWADEAETGYFALAPDWWGEVFVFGEDGAAPDELFVFAASYAPDTTEADVEELRDIVRSFEFVAP